MKIAALMAGAACWIGGLALAESPDAATTPCPAGNEVTQRHLLGLWRARFDGLAQGATLLLERHPEFADSVRGAINRDGDKALVAGDVEDGEFSLEESVDGVRINATWNGTVVDGSCGREIRGDWQAATGGGAHSFVLRRQ